MGAAASDDHYAWLGVGAEADALEVRRAWRGLALKWHPDRAGPAAAATFRKIAAAYAVLSDPVARPEEGSLAAWLGRRSLSSAPA